MAGSMAHVAIPFVKLHPDAQLPSKAHNNDLGWDFYVVQDDNFNWSVVNEEEHYALMPSESYLFSLGIAGAIPDDYGVLFRDRSGNAAKHQIHVLAGVIDSTYRREWMVCLINLGKRPFIVRPGDRIVQGILVKRPEAQVYWADSLSETERVGGFGSTGR